MKGKKELAYLPNPGRLWELFQYGKNIFLEKKKNGNLKYWIWGTEFEDEIIMLNSSYCNEIAEFVIEKYLGYKILKKEYKFQNHRFNFLVKDKNEEILLEVKSCTLFKDEISMFPDAPTKRGKEHIDILKKQKKGIVLFFINNSKVKYFLPEFHTDPEFSKSLYLSRKFLKIIPLVLKWDKNLNFEIIREAKIPWEIYESEGMGGGSYIFSGYLERERKIKFGKNNYFKFKKGWYLYVGSGMVSLAKRIRRHKRKEKKFFWHIDYFRNFLKNIKIFPIYSSKRLECEISRGIESFCDGFVNFFGCSDCHCKSHLFYLKEEPIRNPHFIELLLNFRMKNVLKDQEGVFKFKSRE